MTWDLFQLFFSNKGASETEPASKPVWDDPEVIEFKVREIVATQLERDISEVALATNAYDEGDSVGTLEIIMLCEETFEIEIPDEEAQHLETVGQIAKYIQAKLGM